MTYEVSTGSRSKKWWGDIKKRLICKGDTNLKSVMTIWELQNITAWGMWIWGSNVAIQGYRVRIKTKDKMWLFHERKYKR